MKVAEYRQLLTNLSMSLGSLKSAVGERERINEARWVFSDRRRLVEAVCRRASDRDRARAELLIEEANRLLADGLGAVVVRLEAADANLTRMAFAGEWR